MCSSFVKAVWAFSCKASVQAETCLMIYLRYSFSFLVKVGVSSHKTHVIKILKRFRDANERAGAVKLLRDVC